MKRGRKKRKRLLALLSAAAAVLSLAGGGIGAAFAMAAVKKSSPVSAPSPSHPSSAFQNAKAREKEVLEAKAKAKEDKQRPALLASSTDDSSSPHEAYAFPGQLYSTGYINTNLTSISPMQIGSSTISYKDSMSLSVSSGLLYVPFNFAAISPITSQGSIDVSALQKYILEGNWASNNTIGIQNTPTGITNTAAAYKPPSESIVAPFFGGVNPQTGEPLNGISTSFNLSSSTGGQTFEAYVISSCIDNSSLPNGTKAAAALAVSSPSPSSCLAAFQKNAKDEVRVNGASYSLLSYQGLSSLMPALRYKMPINVLGEYGGYAGPAIAGPVEIQTGLSGTLMYFLASYLSYPQSDPAYFTDSISVFAPPSYSQAEIKNLQDSSSLSLFQQFPAHFKAYSETGQPLKQVKIALRIDSYPWPGKVLANIGENSSLEPVWWDPENLDANNPPSVLSPSSSSSSPYQFLGWSKAYLGGGPAYASFTLECNPADPGSFTIPNLVPGTYTATILGEGGAYKSPSFSFTLSSSGSESDASSGSYNGIRGENGKGKKQKTLQVPSSAVTNSNDGIPTKESRGAGLNWICVWPTGAPAFGAAFSVQNSQGLYLYNTGSGWAFGSKQDAQQFSSVSSSTTSPSGALFEILGLPFGTYTVSETSAASGADPDVLPSFSATLNSNGTETISSTPASLGLVGNTPKGTPFNSNVFNTVESSVKSLGEVPSSQLASSSNSSSPSSSQTFASSNDPDGFVDASQETVITDSSNPSVGVLNSKGEIEKDPNPSHEEGQGNAFSYQLSAFLPFSSPFSIEIDPGTGYGIELQEGKVSGIPISSLEEHGASLSGTKLTLNSSAIAYIEQNGFMPASATLPVGSEKLSTSSGSQRVFSVEFPAFLTSSFKAGDAVSYSLYYSNSAPGRQGQTITGSFDGISEVTPWFRAVSQDGSPVEKVFIKWSDFAGASGALSLASQPGEPGFFILPSSFLPDMENGNRIYIEVREGSAYGGGFTEAFSEYISDGESHVLALTDNGDFFDPSTRTVVVNAQNPSAQLISKDGKVDSSPYPTATVGKANPFTYQIQFFLFLPYSSLQYNLSIQNQGYGLINDPAGVKIAGLPLSTLEEHGVALDYSSSGSETFTFSSQSLLYIEQNGFLPATPSLSLGSIRLTSNASSASDRILSVTFPAYLGAAQDAKAPTYSVEVQSPYARPLRQRPSSFSLPSLYTNGPANNSLPPSLAKAATVSSLPLSSPSSSTGLWFINGLEDACGADATQFTVQNSSGQYLSPVENDGTFEGWQFSSSPYDFKGSDFNKFPYYYLFTFGGLANGTYTIKSVERPDISFTSSLSYSSPQLLSGSGSFSFVESNPGPDSLGPISWRMNYGVKDGVLEMTNSIGDPVSQLNPADAYGLISYECTVGVPTPPAPTPAAPSHLPFTGGKGVLGLSLASSFLFLLGAGVWWGLKKKRGSHASSSSSRHGL